MPNNDISVANHARIYFVVCSMRSIAITVTAICAMVVFVAQTGSAQSKRKSAAEWKKTLPPNLYEILVELGSVAAYNNAYWNNHEKGVYVSAATGEVLFTSDDKYDCHTGWPSFVKPDDPSKIEIVTD